MCSFLVRTALSLTAATFSFGILPEIFNLPAGFCDSYHSFINKPLLFFRIHILTADVHLNPTMTVSLGLLPLCLPLPETGRFQKQNRLDYLTLISYNETKGGLEGMGTRVFYLDFIRAFSIFLIIVFHFNVHTLQLQISDSAIFWMKSRFEYPCLAVLGISLFIILSGASLMLSSEERFGIKTFFKKRFLSIYPLFWVTYAATFLTLLLIHRGLPPAPHPWTFLLTIIGFDGFLFYAIPNYYLIGEWFLGFIVIMYMIFPFVRYLFLKNAMFTVLLGIIITLLVAEFYHPEMDVFHFPLFRLAEFVLGMSFVYFYTQPRGRLSVFLIAAAGLLFYFSINVKIPAPFNVVMQGISVFTLLAVISGLFDNSLFGKFISFISRYSFGAFLVHHVFFLQALHHVPGRHLTVLSTYLLFFVLLFIVYAMSFLLTQATALGLRKIAAAK